MSLRVFVSSTKDDLDRDCRPRVIEAVANAEAVPVVMETWPAEYVPALQLVREKIDESTHYLGLFAYRRGWTPPGCPVSITEEEFDYACKTMGGSAGRRIAVFVPLEGSEIADTLRRRAEEAQELADCEAQVRFLGRVLQSAVVQPFRDVPDLSSRTTRCVIFWNTPLLERQIRLHREHPTTPRPDEVAELGRRQHVNSFETHVLPRLVPTRGASAAGVLVAGPTGYGHAQLAGRLHRLFESASRRTHTCSIGCRPLWRNNGVQGLLRVLGKEVGMAETDSVAAAGAHLGKLLAQKDVVLRVTQVQHFESGVPGFVELFWRPLIESLPTATPFRLLCLVTYEGNPEPHASWSNSVQPCETDTWEAGRLALLPPLEPFTAAELEPFVRRRVEPDEVEALVSGLLDCTSGIPHLLFNALMEPSTWES